MGKCEIIELTTKLFFCTPIKERRFYNEARQVIIDGTQLYSTQRELDGKGLHRTHNRGTEKEYQENYYYVLEAKLVLHRKILISIQTEFVDNEDGKEMGKQDCERKACWRLMEKVKKAFPRLPICLCGDSLYACEGFFGRCGRKNWRYIVRYKEGSIPSIAGEYRKLKRLEKNYQERMGETGKNWYDYITDIDYKGNKVNLAEYGESRERVYKKGKKKGEIQTSWKEFWFLTDLPVTRKNITDLIERGRMRWKIENEGFNAQKKHGYGLGHLYGKDYQGLKNHYYLLQVRHMISQCMEAWEKIWKKVKQSLGQKHRRLLECMKETPLEEHKDGMERKIQIRFI